MELLELRDVDVVAELLFVEAVLELLVRLELLVLLVLLLVLREALALLAACPREAVDWLLREVVA